MNIFNYKNSLNSMMQKRSYKNYQPADSRHDFGRFGASTVESWANILGTRRAEEMKEIDE